MNVGDFVEYWYTTYRITRHAPSTAALAKNYIHVHIQPSTLGQMEITEARTMHYQMFLRDLLMHGNKCKLASLNTYGQQICSNAEQQSATCKPLEAGQTRICCSISTRMQ